MRRVSTRSKVETKVDPDSSRLHVYKYVDDIDRLLASLWETFPNYRVSLSKEGSLGAGKHVISNLKFLSLELCENFEKFLGLNVEIGGSQGAGSFGSVGPLYIIDEGDRKIITLQNLSISDSGRIVLFYSKVFIKRNRQPQELKLSLVKSQTSLTYVSSDFLHEGIVQGLVSHLYDLGVCPHFTKNYGLYVCAAKETTPPTKAPPRAETPSPSPSTYYNYAILDQNTITLDSLVRSQYLFALTSADLINLLVQAAYTFYVGKKYYGLTHFDTHPGNLMFACVKYNEYLNKILGLPLITAFCKGVDLSEVDVLQYQVDGSSFVVPNSGLIFKLIDYGLTVANFRQSELNRDLPITFRNVDDIYGRAYHVPQALDKQGTHGDLDYNYAALSVLYLLLLVVKYPEKTNVLVGQYDALRRKALQLYLEVYEFIKYTAPGWKETSLDLGVSAGGQKLSIRVPDIRGNEVSVDPATGKQINSGFRFVDLSFGIMHDRDVGTTADILSPLKRIYEYCVRKDLVRGGTAYPGGLLNASDRTLKISAVAKISPSLNEFGLFTESYRRYSKTCPGGKVVDPSLMDSYTRFLKENFFSEIGTINDPSTLCELGRQSLSISNPNHVTRKSLFQGTVSPKNFSLWDYNNNTLKSEIVQADLKGYEVAELGSSNDYNYLTVYGLELYPSTYNMKGFVYTPDQTRGRVAGAGAGEQGSSRFLDKISFYCAYYGNAGAATIAQRSNLYTSLAGRPGNHLSVGAGYYIQNVNINNPLTPLDKQYAYVPIGYYYSKDEPWRNGTVLPVPADYRNWWATVHIKDGFISLTYLPEFYSKHLLQKVATKFQVTSSQGVPGTPGEVQGKVFEATVDDIVVQDRKVQTSLDYDYAFDTGPILVWDSKIVFNPKVIIDETLTVNLNIAGVEGGKKIPYKLNPLSGDNKKFTSRLDDPENSYGQRQSNQLSRHTVLAETKEGDIIVFVVEGLGYTTLGVDRGMLANLVSKFDVRKAVCIGLGLPANATISFDGQIEWLTPSPYHGQVGTILTLSPK